MKQSVCWIVLLALCASLFGGQLPRDEFRRVKLVRTGSYSKKPLDAVLAFTSDRFVIESKKSGQTIAEMPYESIQAAQYSYSKHPRWKSAAAAAVAVGVFAVPFLFMKGKKHWLTVRTEDDYAVLRLDKKNFKQIIPAFEMHSGVEVEMLGEGESKN